MDGDRLYLDASLVKANASLGSLVSRPLYSQLPGVDDYVRRLWAENEDPARENGEDRAMTPKAGGESAQAGGV
ncbi:MAG: hypothetical protein C4551_01950 [Bacillota bacterium]|nr:MAG: hypothetical protein C4551_01950 [Bacillota bacterium]